MANYTPAFQTLASPTNQSRETDPNDPLSSSKIQTVQLDSSQPFGGMVKAEALATPAISGATPTFKAPTVVASTAPSFYRVKNATTGVDDLYDAKTNTRINPTDWSTNYATKAAKEVKAPSALPTPPVSPINNTVPTGDGKSPTLPEQTATQEKEAYLASVKGQAETASQALKDSYATQLASLDEKGKAAQSSIDAITAKQETALGNVQEITAPFRANLETTERERLKINENFEANQALTNELQGLLTEGNNLVSQMKGVTGLAGIRNPRINEAIDGVNARVGVINAVMAARNSQIGTAETMIDRTVSAITADRNDQINYYNSLLNFYVSEKSTAQTKLTGIEGDKKTFLNAQINLLQQKVEETKATSDYIKSLMVNPDTATAIAKAGVTLNDSVEQINAKLSKYSETKDFNDKVNALTEKGYEYLVIAPKDMTDVVSFNIGDRTVYFKKPAEDLLGGTTPSSYKEWQLAGSPGTYADWIKTGTKNLTVDQAKARQFAVSAKNADEILNTNEYDPGIIELSFMPNVLKGEKRQVFEQAARAFVNSVLRRESGATITDSEFTNKYRELIPQAGDGDDVKANKRLARAAAVMSIQEAGLLSDGDMAQGTGTENDNDFDF